MKKNSKKIIVLSLLIALLAVVFVLLLSSCDLTGGLDTIEQLYVQDYEQYKVNIGKAVALDNIKLMAVRKSGAIERDIPVTVDMIADYSREHEGQVEIFVSYENAKTSFLVEYVKPVIVEIEIEQMPSPFTAIEGQVEELNLTDLKLKVRYEDDDKYSIVEGIREANIEGYNSHLTPGEHTIYLNYYNKKLPLVLTVLEKSIEKITVDKLQRVRDYIVGDQYQPGGLELIVEYNNKTKELVVYDSYLPDDLDDFSFVYGSTSSQDTSFIKSDTKYPLIVSYKGGRVTVYCRVFDAKIRNIEMLDFSTITSQPINLNGAEVTYSFSENIPEGVRINASTGNIRVTYDDGKEEFVSLDSHLVSLYVSLLYEEAANEPIDKIRYRFKRNDKKLFIRYKNSAQTLEFNINIIPPRPIELNLVGLEDVITKKYYNGQRFDDSLIRFNVLYNNGLHKHQISPDISIEEQYESWSRVSDGLSVESSLLLNIEDNIISEQPVQREISYSIGGVIDSFMVSIYPRVVVKDTIYVKEPEKTYYSVDEIMSSANQLPIIRGGYVGFSIEGGPRHLTRVYLNSNFIKYFDSSSVEVTSFSTGAYTAQVEIRHASLDIPFNVEYDVEVGENTVEEVELGEMINDVFTPIDLAKQINFDSIDDFNIENYYARHKIAGNTNYEDPTKLTLTHLYQVRKDKTLLSEQVPILSSGNVELDIRYLGFIKHLHLHFKSQNIRGIEIIQFPKTIYTLGEEFSIDNLVVARVNEESQISLVKEQSSFYDNQTWEISGYDPYKLGEQIITVIYQPYLPTKRLTTYRIKVQNKIVESIFFDVDDDTNKQLLIDYQGQKALFLKHKAMLITKYAEKEIDDNTGKLIDVEKNLKLQVKYSDSTTEYIKLQPQHFDIESWYDVSLPLNQTSLLKVAKISYAGKETSVNILVSTDVELTEVKMFKMPNRTAFVENEDLDLTGGEYELVYTYLGRSYRFISSLTSAYTKMYGYNNKISIPGDKIEQTLYATFMNEEMSTELELLTYRKVNPTFSVIGLISDYGATPRIEVKVSKVESFVLPDYSLEFLVNDTWTRVIPLTPNEYDVRVNIYQNLYYNDMITESHKLIIQKRKIIILLSDKGKQKEYQSIDPDYMNEIASQTQPLLGDVISYSIGRELGENVGEYLFNITANASEGNHNEYYDFIITPSTFIITSRQLNKASVEVEITGNASDGYNLTVRHSGVAISRDDFNILDSNGAPIEGLTPGSYYIEFNANYALYSLDDNYEKIFIEPKRYAFEVD